MEEQQALLIPNEENAKNLNEYVYEGWSDGSSCSSCYSDSDSSVPEWESSIDSTGDLLFIDCDPVVSHSINQLETENPTTLSKTRTRRSTRSKFLKLLRRHDSKRRSKHYQKSQETVQLAQDTNKVKFQDYEEGEEREVTLKIDQEIRKLGRRATLLESFLGLTVSTLSDGSRVMIAGFIPDSEATKQKNIKIGDWFKSINNLEVTFANLNSVLEQLSAENEVTLKLQQVAGIEVTKNPPINELSNQSNFVQTLTSTKVEDVLSSALCKEPVGVLYLDTANLTENGPEYEGVLYCFPTPNKKNLLCNSRGVFITLNQLLKDITKAHPQMSSVLVDSRLAHVVYVAFGSKLLLLMLPDYRANPTELKLISSEVIRTIEFCYQSVDRCFQSDFLKGQVDHFFSRFFTRFLSSNPNQWRNDVQSFDLKGLAFNTLNQSSSQFEDILPGARFLTLPDEAQMQIDDALCELEASDYREWNEDPLDCQRLFTILGSALYHSGYLLASHFVHGDLIDVHVYCRQQGLFHLSRTEPVRTLILWREVFPTSCNRGLESTSSLFKVQEGRRYLLIVGSGKDILVVLMEAGGATEPAEDNMGPDAFYVEEAQATLAHLQELGISELASRWILTNPGHQVVVPELPAKRRNDFLGNIPFTKSTSPSQQQGTSSPILKKPEVTSILKRRSSDQGLLSSSSVFSLADDSSDVHSEDSASQGGYSEVSDEPVLGRRAIREKRGGVDSDDEDSDVDEYREGSQMSNSSYDLSEIRNSLLSETEDAHLFQLTAGVNNVLFHYVQIDTTEGLLLCPPDCRMSSKMLDVVLNNFRESSQKIHKLFQNTLRFKNMLAQDMAKSVINKSLIAIKEHGTLFECTFQEDSPKKSAKICYWVIGRLFYNPHPREVYVCYQDAVPQNIVEIAFKLGASA